MCNNKFLENDGFCVKCGTVHKTPKKRPMKKAPKSTNKTKIVAIPAVKYHASILPIESSESEG